MSGESNSNHGRRTISNWRAAVIAEESVGRRSPKVIRLSCYARVSNADRIPHGLSPFRVLPAVSLPFSLFLTFAAPLRCPLSCSRGRDSSQRDVAFRLICVRVRRTLAAIQLYRQRSLFASNAERLKINPGCDRFNGGTHHVPRPLRSPRRAASRRRPSTATLPISTSSEATPSPSHSRSPQTPGHAYRYRSSRYLSVLMCTDPRKKDGSRSPRQNSSSIRRTFKGTARYTSENYGAREFRAKRLHIFRGFRVLTREPYRRSFHRLWFFLTPGLRNVYSTLYSIVPRRLHVSSCKWRRLVCWEL